MQSRTLRRIALSGCAGALFAGTSLAAHAAPVSIKYLFNETSDVAIYANPGLDPTSIVPAAITAISSWSDLAGTLIEVPPFTGPDPVFLTNDDGLNGLNQSRAVAARGWDTVTANAFVFTLTIVSGFSLSIDQISFFQQGSNGGQGLGPTSWQMFINGTQAHLGDTATRGSLTQRTLDSSNSFLNTMATDLEGTVEFRIFATGAQTGPEEPLHPMPHGE